jgi:hypothetical protein
VISDSPFMPKIDHQSHRDTLKAAAHFFPGLTLQNMLGRAGFAVACSNRPELAVQ